MSIFNQTLSKAPFKYGHWRVITPHICNQWDPFYEHGLTLIPAWIDDYMRRNVWDEITYQFPNFNAVTVEVWEWMNEFIPCVLIPANAQGLTEELFLFRA